MKQRILIAIFLWGLAGPVFSQKAALEISSQDSIPFSLLLNEQLRTSEPIPAIFLPELSPGKHYCRFTISDSIQLERTITLRPAIQSTYRLEKEEGGYSLELVSEAGYIPDTSDLQEDSLLVPLDSAAKTHSLTQYKGRKGCPGPVMSEQAFGKIRDRIAGKIFENDKVRSARQAVRQECMSSEQVRQLVALFEFEDTKLSFARFAFPRTYDQERYAEVLAPVFDFDASREALDKFTAPH